MTSRPTPPSSAPRQSWRPASGSCCPPCAAHQTFTASRHIPDVVRPERTVRCRHDDRRHSVGTAARRHRGRAPHRRTRPAADDTPEQLYALWDSTIERSRARLDAAVADGGLDQLVHLSWDGRHLSLRRLVCDLIEEYGRHTGHADLLREAVDGLVGEDPPAGWRP